MKESKISTSPYPIWETGIIKNFVVAFQNFYAYRNMCLYVMGSFYAYCSLICISTYRYIFSFYFSLVV